MWPHFMNFSEEYNEMSNDLGSFVNHLKDKSNAKFEEFRNTVGGASAVAITKIKNNVDSAYNKIGGVIYQILND